MLVTVGPSDSLFELLLPAGMRVLSGELAEIDAVFPTCLRYKPHGDERKPERGFELSQPFPGESATAYDPAGIVEQNVE